MYQSGGYKRDRMDDGEGYGPPQKRHSVQSGSYGGGGSAGNRQTPAYSNYTSSSKASARMPVHSDEKPHNILLFTVFNPKYPITVDVMHTICTANGAVVNRIVIFRKNGVQAMVEFESIKAAESVKESLNGADIYSGCCTLKIDWGKPTRLNVVKNDQDSWDYTTSLEKEPMNKSQPLLPDPKVGPAAGGHYGGMPGGPPRRGGPAPAAAAYGYEPYPDQVDPYDPYRRMPQPAAAAENYPLGPMPRGPRPQVDVYGVEGYGPHPPRQQMPHRGPHPAQPPAHHMQNAMAAGYEENVGAGPGMLQQGCVLMVYGLNSEKFNCQRLFNLFCLYGNVVRVKFLKSKEGVAMIQLGDNASCERAIKNINGIFVFGQKMLLGYSKQAFIQDVPNPVDLADGTPSFMDFMGNRNNRFTTPEAAAKNRIQPASKVLYFFNTPSGLKEDDLNEVFIGYELKPPSKIKVFLSKSERSSTGLLEWDNKSDCVEGLVVANHTPIPNPTGKNPYIMKFCFSDAPIKP